MILTDASVVIDYQRAKGVKLLALVRTLSVGVCGITRSEVVGGARTPAEHADSLRILNAFHQVSAPEAVWDRVGDHLAALRAAGLRLPFPDVVLATLGVHLNVEVWARDQHFPLMQPHLPGLRLFVEPP
jgi:predicted nucleic acid-binding protein